MTRFFSRIGWSVVVVWFALSLAFAMSELLPGDSARLVAGIQARPADVMRIRKQLGLDRSPLVRYVLFWRRLVHEGPAPIDPTDPQHGSCALVLRAGSHGLHLDLGKSFQMRQPVLRILAARLPRTAALAFAGALVQLLIGLSAGTWAAVARGSWVDRAIVGSTVLGMSAPTFLTALLLQTILARELGWLPIDGFGSTFAEHARSIVLPALTLGIYGSAFYTRLVRDEVAFALRRDWVRTAHAKGLPGVRIVLAHALRNALLPVVTALALDVGALFGGAIVTETIFRWPGLGELSVRATFDRDGPVLCGCVIVAAVAVVLANLVADLSYGRLDPRVIDRRGRDNR